MKNKERDPVFLPDFFRFSEYYYHFPYPVIEVDTSGKIINSNPSARQFFQKNEVKTNVSSKLLFDGYFSADFEGKFKKVIKKGNGVFFTKSAKNEFYESTIEVHVNRIKQENFEKIIVHLLFITNPGILEEEFSSDNSGKEKVDAGKWKELSKTIKDKFIALTIKYQETKKREKRFQDIVEMLPGIVIEVDKKGQITFINKNATKILGYTEEELLQQKKICQLISIPGCKKIKPKLEELLEVEAIYPQEYSLIKKDQSLMPVEILGTTLKNETGEAVGFRGIILDTTLRKEYEDKIRYLSFHDKLTDLYNRAYFEEELKRLDDERNIPISIIMGDVNNLKTINDTFGHQQGDKLLQKIASILKSSFRKSDVVSRWGGDEFGIILPLTSKEKGLSAIDRIIKKCQKSSTLTLPLSISMGIAVKENSSENIYSTIREAESKMYRYKLIDKKIADVNIIQSLEKALQKKRYETKEYRKNFIKCALSFGIKLKLEKQQIQDLKLLATLCDMGKVAISEEIILKKGWLTESEWEEIKRHPEVGFRIAKSSPEIAHIADAILYHHEYWNGKGYPKGKKEKEIPLLARIIHIVNAYQAMIHNRPYRSAMKKKEAIGELKKGKGVQFDPKLTEAFIAMIS